MRIKAAGFSARKTLEYFDWDAQPTDRQQIAGLASGELPLEAQNVVLLGARNRDDASHDRGETLARLPRNCSLFTRRN